MYGLVNTAIRDLIVGQHSQEVWERVCARAGSKTTTFVGMERYPDALTYDLVTAASVELDAPVDALLEAFGRYWMTFTAEQGYGGVLEFAGASLVEFLGNLDDLHARITLNFPELLPPSFQVDELASGELELHYYSDRPGLAPMVIGLLRGLAQRFGEEIRIEHVPPAGESDHDRFRIRTETGRRAEVA